MSRWAPYGYQHDTDGQLVAEPREQAGLAAIADLRHSGLSLRAMSGKLEAQGVTGRNGRAFQANVLAKILRQVPIST